MISARLVGNAAARDRLTIKGNTAISGISRAIAKREIDLQNHVRRDKLSGQALKVRSGSAKEGIVARTKQSGVAVNATIHAGAIYAAAGQYGFTGTANFRASLHRIKAAFGYPIAAVTDGVSASCSRRMGLPQRSFLHSTLDNMATDIHQGILDALHEALG